MNTVAYPTRHNGILFRSRLEAKWATFFDLLGWPYVYEPFDLEGYIPDFILLFHEPLLVEVKPELYFKDLKQHAAKIENSGWDKEALIVGATVFCAPDGWPDGPWDTAGLLGRWMETKGRAEPRARWYFKARFNKCQNCNRPTIFADPGPYLCRVCGSPHVGDQYTDCGFRASPLWNQAGELTQWHPQITRETKP